MSHPRYLARPRDCRGTRPRRPAAGTIAIRVRQCRLVTPKDSYDSVLATLVAAPIGRRPLAAVSVAAAYDELVEEHADNYDS